MGIIFVHSAPGEQVESISGHYVIQKEALFEAGGRHALVVFGVAVVDRSCCGTGACRFARVAGYVTKWADEQAPRSAEAAVEVEPVTDETEKSAIEDAINSSELYCQILFDE